MAEHNGPATIEWGHERVGWVSRLLGREPDRPGDAVRLSRVGLGCVIAAFALILAAELLPWMVINSVETADQSTPNAARVGTELYLGQVGSLPALMYDAGWMALLALVAVHMVSPPALRRMLAAAALGVAGGQLALLFGLVRAIKEGGGLLGGGNVGTVANTSLGIGVYAAFAALVFVLLGVALAGRRPGRRVATAPPARVEEEPADLTVTPLPASQQTEAG
jgi:hypothetical protein